MISNADTVGRAVAKPLPHVTKLIVSHLLS